MKTKKLTKIVAKKGAKPDIQLLPQQISELKRKEKQLDKDIDSTAAHLYSQLKSFPF